MKKFISIFSLAFLYLISASFVSATSTPVPSCESYNNFEQIYVSYLDTAIPVYMNSELTKLNKPQIDTFTKQASNWIGKQVEWDFLWDWTTAVGSKVQFELNKLSKRFTILNDIHSSLNSDGKWIEDVSYTVDGIKKLLTNSDTHNFLKTVLCSSSEIPNNDMKNIQSGLERTKKLLKTETEKIKSWKLPKSYAKSVNLAIWKQKILFETNNSENYFQEHCTYDSKLEAYNCGG